MAPEAKIVVCGSMGMEAALGVEAITKEPKHRTTKKRKGANKGGRGLVSRLRRK